jgi:RNase H-fold protein (predicted Holliday junction resolvase)|tara:strand:- start:887 stop:1417 length:531 start_codon:yes stop_codon:yes gene_type:complete
VKILGLDISSSKIGIALLDKEEIVISEVLKFKSSMSLEERAEIFQKRMQQINDHHVIYEVFVEQPAMMFKGGKTTAFTMATLQRFNGMTCYITYKVFEMEAELVNPLSARSILGIKVPRGIPPKDKKRFIIERMAERFEDSFKYEMTRHQNPQPGTDDRADALVVALAGPLLLNKK